MQQNHTWNKDKIKLYKCQPQKENGNTPISHEKFGGCSKMDIRFVIFQNLKNFFSLDNLKVKGEELHPRISK